MGNKIKLIPAGLTFSHSQRGAYALILTEEIGQRRLPIIIGGFEAQAIAIELEKMKPPRPLTHDLILNIANSFDIQIREVIIHELKDGIFYAKLICCGPQGNEVELDSRTSDAIALSLRFGCPIYTYEEVLDEAGIVLGNSEIDLDVKDQEDKSDLMGSTNNPTSEQVKSTGSSQFGTLSSDELTEMMNKAIQDEDYEKASIIRDELKKRNQDDII